MTDEMRVRGSEMTEKKTPEQLGAEIRMYVDAGRRISLLCGIEIGRRLVQAKEMLDHGEWLPWLERETEFSERSAQRYMKLFDEYGASQLGLFGPEANTPTLSDLPISKAFALLSVPESDRVEFAEEVDAEHISVRELEQKIRERDEQLAEAERRAEALRKDAEGNSAALEEAKKQIRELAKLNEALESRPVEVAVETVRDEAAIEAAAKEAREKAEAEKEKDAKDYEKTVSDLNKKLLAAEKERDKVKSAAESSGAEAEKRIAEANREADRIRAELEEAKKQLKTSSADVTAFGIRFNSLQSEWGYMIAELTKVRKREPETGEKLCAAVRQLVEHFRKELETADV